MRPRYKDYLETLYCLSVDWTEGLMPLYGYNRRGPLVLLGWGAQMFWHLAHNNRLYNWLDEYPEDVAGESGDR